MPADRIHFIRHGEVREGFTVHGAASVAIGGGLVHAGFSDGTLVGLEIPLVMRILKRHRSQRWALRELVSEVLTFDYLGALLVALAFPLLFVPHLGLIRTGVFFGLLNAAVAVWALLLFLRETRVASAQLRIPKSLLELEREI